MRQVARRRRYALGTHNDVALVQERFHTIRGRSCARVVHAPGGHGLSVSATPSNPNLARRWVLEAERRGGGALASAANRRCARRLRASGVAARNSSRAGRENERDESHARNSTPLQNDREIRAAAQVGFNVTQSLHSVRIMGLARPGIAAELTKRLAAGDINLRGFSASEIGTQFVAYIAVDSLGDANKAMEILSKV